LALPRRAGRSRVTLVFLILMSLTIITLDFRDDGDGVVNSVRDAASDVLSPARNALDGVLTPVGEAFSGITGYGSLRDENDRLRAEVEELRGDLLEREDAKAERRELLALNGLDDELAGLTTVAARVIGAPVSNFAQTIELNRGIDQGVAVDMPVVTGSGLVGRVVEASGSRSTVRLITDPRSSVGVRFSRSGEAGIADGEGPDTALSVGFIETSAQLRRRDLAVTSGLEGGSELFPPNIPVGRVVSASRPSGELQQRVELEPLADLDDLRFVKVVQMRPS
jgi:rod shape-determining protein MreC